MSLIRKYRGRLTSLECSKGIDVCLRNSTSLLEEAQILLENNKIARANFLALTALEEIGKVAILINLMALPNSQDEVWNEFWGEFYKHTGKYKTIGQLMFIGHLMVNPKADINKLIQHPYITELARIRSLYVEYSDKSKSWLNPLELFPKETVQRNIITILKINDLFNSYNDKKYFNPAMFEVIRKYLNRFSKEAKYGKTDVYLKDVIPKNKLLLTKLMGEFFIEVVTKKILSIKAVENFGKEMDNWKEQMLK